MSRIPRSNSLAVHCPAIAVLLLRSHAVPATESIEFVQEHLAEIPMDNRYATLPLWSQSSAEANAYWQFTTQFAHAKTKTGELAIDGPMISMGASRLVGADWKITGFAFLDDLNLSSGIDHRPLQVGFARDVPLALPVAAEFTDLSGSARSSGLGFAVRHASDLWLLHSCEWTAGVLWHRVELRDYALDFRILEGPDSGATGVVDYSATYSHIAPFAGIAWPRKYGDWGLTPHVQAVLPLPRRGVAGHITGPGYDISGDTDKNRGETPFGDPSVTLGLDITYRPWNLTVDIGSAVSQALLEPIIHRGIESNWLISTSWTF
jgi:hypothetical protein